MRMTHRISLPGVLALAVVLVAVSAPAVLSADLPAIVFELPDTTAPAGDHLVWLTLRLSNYADTVAGVQFQLRLDRPDLIRFDLSGPDFDTASSLLGRYEMVLGRDTAADHSRYNFIGLANIPQSGPDYLGFPPQAGDVLVRIPVRTAADPDPGAGLVCTIDVLSPIVFSDPSGNAIGWHVTDTVLDTIFYKCTMWEEGACLSWISVDPAVSTYDSMYIFEIYTEEPDPTQLIVGTGRITVLPDGLLTCDHNADGTYSVTDLTCLVSYLFRTAGSNCPNMMCDCDASGNNPSVPNVADLTCMVGFIFRGGPPPGE